MRVLEREALDAERNARVDEYGLRYTDKRREQAQVDFEAGWNECEAALAARGDTKRCGSCGLEHSFKGDCGKPLSYWLSAGGDDEDIEGSGEGPNACVCGHVRGFHGRSTEKCYRCSCEQFTDKSTEETQ